MSRFQARVARRHHRVPTQDGELLDLDEIMTSGQRAYAAPEGEPVLVLHGLEGSSTVGYVTETCERLLNAGLRPFALNMRTCGPSRITQARSYHAGETEDLETALAYIQSLTGHDELGAIGFSLGGNQLLKHLGARGDDSPIKAGVSISAPFHLAACSEHLSQGFNRLYTAIFLRSLKRKIKDNRDLLGRVCDVPTALEARDLETFDNAIIAPMFGFKDARDYYDQSSCAGYLEAIDSPTLIIRAGDDPFMPKGTIPHRIISMNPNLFGLFPPHGGHVGFIDLRQAHPVAWAEDQSVVFIAQVLAARRTL